MTGAQGLIYDGDVEIRDTPLQRSFAHPRRHEVPTKSVVRLYGSCTTPVYLKYDGHMDHELAVRCRHCPSCIRARRYQWSLRAQWEIINHPATWFFTGTFRDQGHDYEPAKREVQRFLKRLRARAADRDRGSVRYLMLPELHRSGAIHYHGLLHHGGDITYRMVRDSWTAGYSYPSAVRSPEKTAKYVTKYCTKDLLGGGVDSTGRSRRPRIMASRAPTYGDPVILRDADLVQAVQATHAKDLTEIWETNLRQAIRELEKSKAPRSVERQLMELQAAQGLTE